MATNKTASKKTGQIDSSKPAAKGNGHNPAETANDLVNKADGRYAIHQSICSTCVHQPNCLFVKAIRRPIQFCDEFDDKPGNSNA